MSSGNTTADFTSRSIIDTLDLVKLRFLNQLPIIIVILGSIGFIGDAFTFLQPNLRRNSFCIYSLVRSFIDVSNLYINLLPVYIFSPDKLILIFVGTQACRWKLFALLAIPQLSMNLLIVSLIDRYSCTCAITSPIQKIRKLKYVPYLITFTIGISCVMSLYAPLLFHYVPGMGCVPTNFILYGSLYVIIHGLFTPLLMLILVWMAYRNVRRSRQRVGTVATGVAHQPRHHFIHLVFTQVISTAFFVLQWISMYLYHISTASRQRTREQLTIHYFILIVTNNIYFMNNVKSFYLSTLTSRLFRGTFIKSVRKIIRKIPN